MAARMTSTSTAGIYSPATALVLLLPLIALFCGAFLYPVGRLLAMAVFDPDFTVRHLAKAVESPLYVNVFLRTARIAAAVTLAAFALGYPVALLMSRLSGRAALFVTACVLVPLWTSVLVRSYAWIVLLQTNGLVNGLLRWLGLTEGPLKLLYTEATVLVAMTHVLLPYMILPIYGALRAIPADYERAARNLGAGAVTSFITVTLPLSLPGIFAGCLIVFILSLGFYITPALVGGPETLMAATLISQQATELLDWPFASALSLLLLAGTLVVVVVFRRFLSLSKGL
ncbi:ABC transporter permease [Neorhizobium lilium]|uniref:ABC transporter permease n=1 Tax=Neorhizobium lilium TaxID=2503024 RepID=A0A3S3VPX0_9HYPH|nr:ABC transporter permease [Neorhizobium lilium]RWX81434.1 ABC transporter permease [Neorhizobium lilium]